MPDVSICPSGDELRQFAGGILEPVSAENVIQHLRQCCACVLALESMPIEDTLIGALETWATSAGRRQSRGGRVDSASEKVGGPRRGRSGSDGGGRLPAARPRSSISRRRRNMRTRSVG